MSRSSFGEHLELPSDYYFFQGSHLAISRFLKVHLSVVVYVGVVLLIFAGAPGLPTGLGIQHCEGLLDLPMQVPLFLHNLAMELLGVLDVRHRSLGNGREAEWFGQIFHRLLSRSHLNIIRLLTEVKETVLSDENCNRQ